METTDLREKLHNIIEKSSDEELLKILSFIENDYTDEFKTGLDAEYDDYSKNGHSFSKSEVERFISELLNSENQK